MSPVPCVGPRQQGGRRAGGERGTRGSAGARRVVECFTAVVVPYPTDGAHASSLPCLKHVSLSAFEHARQFPGLISRVSSLPPLGLIGSRTSSHAEHVTALNGQYDVVRCSEPSMAAPSPTVVGYKPLAAISTASRRCHRLPMATSTPFAVPQFTTKDYSSFFLAGQRPCLHCTQSH